MLKTWTKEDLEAWRQRNGLSLNDVAALLDMSRRHVSRLLDGTTELRPIYVTVATSFEEKRRRPIDAFMEHELAREAEEDHLDLPTVCKEVPLGFLTGWTAACAYSLCSMHETMLVMAVPERAKVPARIGHREVEAYPRHDINEVLLRETSDGRMYRIASPERTLVDFVDYDECVTSFTEEAFNFGLQRGLDEDLILAIAATRSEWTQETVAKLVKRWSRSGQIG